MESNSTGPGPARDVVLQPEEGDSWWQPLPANGYVTNKLTPENWSGAVSCGIQVVASRSFVRQHSHTHHHEVVCVFSGLGRAVVNGVSHVMQPGTVIGLPPNVEHIFINDGEAELRFFWLIEPHGLAEFFRSIGRPRTSPEAPQPFARPEDVRAIEARTGFNIKPTG